MRRKRFGPSGATPEAARESCGDVHQYSTTRADFLSGLIGGLLTTAVHLADTQGDQTTVEDLMRLKTRIDRRRCSR